MRKAFSVSALLAVFAAAAFAGPQPGSGPKPGFDPKEVVRSVQRVRNGAQGWEDYGEFLIDTSMYLVPAEALKADPAVAYDGTNYLVVWNDERSVTAEPDIYATRVSADGTVLDMAGIAICTSPRGQWYPEVAFDGENYLVVWQDGNASSWDIRGSRVTTDGEVLDPNGFGVATTGISQWRPDIGFDGTNYLVVWMEEVRYDTFDIYGARITPEGYVLDPEQIRICEAPLPQWHPRVTPNPGWGFMVAWQDQRTSYWDVYAARVNTYGAVLDPDGFVVCNTSECFAPDLAFDGTFYLVAWHDERSGSYDIYASRVTTGGQALDPQGIPVSTAGGDQWRPAVEYDGTNFMILWNDERGGNSDVYGTRMTSGGNVLDPSGLVITSASQGQWHPALVFGGGQYLVSWQHDTYGSNREVYVARMATSGQVLDPGGKPTSAAANSQSWPSVASDGSEFLVVWREDNRGSGDIHGARVMADGTVRDPAGFAISSSPSSQYQPVVAFGDSSYLVAWTQSVNRSYEIRGVMVSPDGTVGSPIEITSIQRTQQEPAIGFDGTNFLVAWEDERNSRYWSDIFAARVSQSGQVLDPGGFEVTGANGAQWVPEVEFDGANFLVVWEDSRVSNAWDVRAARVSPDGTVLDTAGIIVSLGEGDQRYPDVAFDGTNYLMVWRNQFTGQGYDVYGARMTPAGTVLDEDGIPIGVEQHDQTLPSVAFGSADYHVVWQHGWAGVWDINGARVSTDGVVLDTFRVVRMPGDQDYPGLAHCSGDQLMLAYRGWTGYEAGKTFNAPRIWGKVTPLADLADGGSSGLRSAVLPATIVRGVLKLPAGVHGVLLDICGRRIADLGPGNNLISHIPDGVYIVGTESGAPVQKVVVQR
ncbi:MAG: hypothetical protein JSU73_07175 [candidate division WOR-3 bacterium]|nr:MAG: hypothetical protein JSU73_07175 [candidate division WOR-3 bacterium]